MNKILVLLFLAITSFASGLALANESKTIFLTRHAEKLSGSGKDPGLTAQGKQRALKLANFLKQHNIQKIYSTNYQRTLMTAKPTAELLEIGIETYDPRDLEAFSQSLTALKVNALVVGHSNTTPQLAALLTNESIIPMPETEYDRLYRIEFKNDKAVTQLLRSNPIQATEEQKQHN